MTTSKLYTPTSRYGEVFVPSMGRTYQFVEWVAWARSWKMDATGQARWRSYAGDEIVVGSIGLDLPPAARVAIDQLLENGDPDAWEMRVRVNRHEKVRQCLVHAAALWPRLHELEMPFSFRDNDDLYILAPRETVVTLSGLIRVPMGR